MLLLFCQKTVLNMRSSLLFCCNAKHNTQKQLREMNLFGLHFRTHAMIKGRQDRNSSRNWSLNLERTLLARLFSGSCSANLFIYLRLGRWCWPQMVWTLSHQSKIKGPFTDMTKVQSDWGNSSRYSKVT